MTAALSSKAHFGFAPHDHVLLVEDHPMVLVSLRSMIQSAYPIVNVLEARNETEAIQLACHNSIRMAIFDVMLDGIKTFETVRQIKIRHPEIKIIFFTGHVSSEVVSNGNNLGANGFISKMSASNEVLDIVDSVMHGHQAMCSRFQKASDFQEKAIDEKGVLTRREREILDYTLLGMTVQEIAKQANISYTTVKKHRQNILQKLNFSSSAKLLAYSKRIQTDPE